MSTDEDKSRLSKLLSGLEVQDVKLTERCFDLVKVFHAQFHQQVEEEERGEAEEQFVNPYVLDKEALRETDAQLMKLIAARKRSKKESLNSEILSDGDPKRPWRTNSCKERLLRIENRITRHLETASERINPLPEERMQELIKQCSEDNEQSVTMTVSEVVEAARKNLPNFQYRRIENSTATAIFQEAHSIHANDDASQTQLDEAEETEGAR